MSDCAATPAGPLGPPLGAPLGFSPPVHPLDAPPEQKLFRADLGRMAVTPGVRLALFVLRGYLGIMAALAAWRLISGL